MHNSSSKSDSSNLYFDLQADFGITKHMGGLKATKELIELCHIDKTKHFLVVGCGIGASLVYIARNFGCKLTAVDISAGMIARAGERVKRYEVEHQIDLKQTDAQELPYEDNIFDGVICESVIAFIQDKQRALKEFKRVAKPGGYIGLNEVTWVKEPPQEIIDYAVRIMAGAHFLNSGDWQKLLISTGLQDIRVENARFQARSQFVEEMKQLNLMDNFKAWVRFMRGMFTDSAYRQFAKDILRQPAMIFKFMDNIGYGLYVGIKPK
jgi:arsenite methyltransferase